LFKLTLDTTGYTDDIYTAIEDILDITVQVHILKFLNQQMT